MTVPADGAGLLAGPPVIGAFAAVRFARRRQGSAVALTAAACAVAWARILLGTPLPDQYPAQLWWTNMGAALVCIGTAVLVATAVRRPAPTP
jgi:peptidoglycan/LPS O-acetylase OafA/YrhL